MKIFLTGGSGFLGSPFMRYALTHEDDLLIVALSRSSVADEKIRHAYEGIKGGEDRVRIVRGSINDEGALREGLDGADIVVHMAAKVQPWGFYEEFERITIGGTRLLLSIIESLPKKPRLIYTSSFTALIGRHFPEGAILPNWAPYSKSKHFSEEYVLKSSIPETICLRLGWLWGKHDNVLLPKLYDLCTNPIWKLVPKCCHLSILHIDNACESIFLACKLPKDLFTTGEKKIYEIEDVEGKISVEDFVDIYVGTAYNMKPPRPFEKFRLPEWFVWGAVAFIESIPLLGYGKKWVIGVISREPLFCIFRDYRLKPKNVKEELGYVGKVSREEGLAELAACREIVPR
ncbi:14004_t:CDS:2 [Acaulospora morrowiae]|uniref:14004_t:CDS:1 n=1 Tax=Acaulospora morrowiae TaxID=94023 RepID=A0A9N9F1C0_9GLOM|nr:14004_t:CDS:2 [Acaulospora morrowiae]